MKVKELIEKLQTMNQESDVFYTDHRNMGFHFASIDTAKETTDDHDYPIVIIGDFEDGY